MLQILEKAEREPLDYTADPKIEAVMDTIQFYTKDHSNSSDPIDGLIWERKKRVAQNIIKSCINATADAVRTVRQPANVVTVSCATGYNPSAPSKVHSKPS